MHHHTSIPSSTAGNCLRPLGWVFSGKSTHFYNKELGAGRKGVFCQDIELLGAKVKGSSRCGGGDCMQSTSLALEFNSTSYFTKEQEHTQAEGHLHVCLQMDQGPETMTSVSPSELLVAEAAACLMKGFNSVVVMQDVLSGFSIHQGEQEELPAMLLLTLAHDKATDALQAVPNAPITPIIQLIQALFTKSKSVLAMKLSISPNKSTPMFQDTFKDAMTHFNHFIKVHQWNSCSVEQLLQLTTHGAFVLCANGQPGFDLCGAGVLDDSQNIAKTNSFVILAQVKNDPSYMDKPVLGLFGLPPSLCLFGPVKQADKTIWNGLLKASCSWEQLYKTCGAAQTLWRHQNPGAAKHGDHWDQ
ncbi:uncharacterized protein EI90DRAFT_3023282 [Cantharellus anzutake]|uniref:uncharacterized protein n=1 Tax=Cantharellus anzutake TaxID=1750568 RepID=UPI001905405F|nr:uncharacterized protein EI90DRAFT_3023282 [Cantharellus anzutake]KAF8312036.1 hypothetical protein EI90DRAFT_3023282 [Cantharellus anzutake]